MQFRDPLRFPIYFNKTHLNEHFWLGLVDGLKDLLSHRNLVRCVPNDNCILTIDHAHFSQVQQSPQGIQNFLQIGCRQGIPKIKSLNDLFFVKLAGLLIVVGNDDGVLIDNGPISLGLQSQ